MFSHVIITCINNKILVINFVGYFVFFEFVK